MEREFIDIPIQGIPQATKEEAKFMGLLNDYLLKYYAEYGNRNLYCELGGWSLLNVHEIVIISKKFGFIQRLAKHFNLNMIKIDARIALSDFNATDRMLMALAISEDPIALLVDCLK